jgi:hypothetical protein
MDEQMASEIRDVLKTITDELMRSLNTKDGASIADVVDEFPVLATATNEYLARIATALEKIAGIEQ